MPPHPAPYETLKCPCLSDADWFIQSGAIANSRLQALGAGEILLNCIDKDGSNSGYDLGASISSG